MIWSLKITVNIQIIKSYISPLPLPKCDNAPWILKQGGLEVSGYRPVSLKNLRRYYHNLLKAIYSVKIFDCFYLSKKNLPLPLIYKAIRPDKFETLSRLGELDFCGLF